MRILFLVAFVLPLLPACAADVTVAAASNLQRPLEAIGRAFEGETGHRVIFSFGSTGKHYAQIRHGAPFDLFFAADAEHPLRLEREGRALAGSRFTYAFGRLVLWSPRSGLVDPGGEVLERGSFKRLAIANPRLAPYGAAAEEVLRKRGTWEGVQSRLVRGENIGQAHQFVVSGNAELGFLALSQVQRPGASIPGSAWIVPEALHRPIEQQAVVLTDHAAARAFAQFCRGETARRVFQSYGYRVP